jgi:hypothetical protein
MRPNARPRADVDALAASLDLVYGVVPGYGSQHVATDGNGSSGVRHTVVVTSRNS